MVPVGADRREPEAHGEDREAGGEDRPPERIY
nr:MAG TPA: hypothetical protein [Caudoviricetes sp.]